MTEKLSYKNAGVDIEKADRFIRDLIPMIRTTRRPGVVGSIGHFSGFFRAPDSGMEDPLLVAATDGVGTKLKIADLTGRHDTIGIDLVAMCVNDIVTCGAEPLFFLDYFATGQIEPEKARDVMKGIVRGCRQAACALLGGETAEMPGLYGEGAYDLAGFCVGIVDRKKMILGKSVKSGDAVIGLASSGIHSNGLSLARRVFSEEELKGKAGVTLLRPTRIYVKPVLALCRTGLVKSLAHITGGGLLDNIPRSLPPRVSARIHRKAWKVPGIFREMRARGDIDEKEMFRTFNMGIGMTVIVAPGNVEEARGVLLKEGIRSSVIGEVIKGDGEVILE